MNNRKQESLQSLGNAIKRLHEAINIPPDSSRISIDATIQRFEFTFELLWKALKIELAQIGIEANSPRACLEEAYRQNWIHDQDTWLQMMKDRNLTSHTYDEATADQIYNDIKQFYAPIEQLHQLLNK